MKIQKNFLTHLNFISNLIHFWNENVLSKAINEWSYLIGKNTEEAEYYSLRGWAYRKFGDYEQSEADYEKAMSLTPDFVVDKVP